MPAGMNQLWCFEAGHAGEGLGSCTPVAKSRGSPECERLNFKVMTPMMLGLRRKSKTSPKSDGEFLGCSPGERTPPGAAVPANPPKAVLRMGAVQT